MKPAHTSFLGLIGYMVGSGAKLFRTKTLLNFASKALLSSFLQKARKLCSILPQNPTRIRFSKKHVFGLNFCTKTHITYFLGQTD
jgi:hypothetical protein